MASLIPINFIDSKNYMLYRDKNRLQTIVFILIIDDFTHAHQIRGFLER